MTYTPMTDDEWNYYHMHGLTERDGSVYACTICGNQMMLFNHMDWEYRCPTCDPEREWYWSHYWAWEAGYEKGRKDAENSGKNF